MLTPNNSRKNRNKPGEIVARNSQTEQGLSSCWCNESKKTDNSGNDYTAPDHAERDEIKSLRNDAEELGERNCPVAGKCPGLAGCGNENGDSHEVLDNHKERH